MSKLEVVVGTLSDLKDGEMKEVAVGEGKALLVNQKGVYSAIGHACSHYGAPLKNGVLHNGHVRCPWHGACFNVTTGDIEDFPGLDGVKKFDVRIEGENVVLSTTEEEIKSGSKRTHTMCPRDQADARVVLILGGGPAGASAVESLRQSGFAGRIVLISKETHLPYDRTKLSKTPGVAADSIALRSKDFYAQHGIELLLGVSVTELAADAKTATLSDGQVLKYDFAIVATGSSPRILNVPGSTSKGVHVLRSPEDSAAFAADAENKNVVIVGSSFIGMEAAAAIAKKAASVTVLGLEAPFSRVFGEKVGAAVAKLHTDNNIKIVTSAAGVKSINTGADGGITGVELADGTVLPGQVVLFGVGVQLNTQFVKAGAGVTVNPDGSISVDKFGHAGNGLYVAGDVARFPYKYSASGSAAVRIEHFQVAERLGSIVGKNIAGKATEIDTVPFFWTAHYGKSVRYAGYADKPDEIIIHGDLSAPKFAAFYVKDGAIVAAASLAADPVVARFASLLSTQQLPTPAQVRDRAAGAEWTFTF
ncbi:disulfide oxidoreductase [Capsaspora owczarzaki ATCC 30864]|nr:disulfide oxidoreductase [Capsaspora owczarzaki ATCC 30864]|eukprot:XP_004343807.1 disulfide oxidoreductase [Capsaspora owczarzaki ATCC 30864]